MADYVTTYVCVDGSTDVLAEFRRRMFSTSTAACMPHEVGREVFDLAALVPIPPDVHDTGRMDDWCHEHWGCPTPAMATAILTEDADTIEFGFDTAWRCPVQVLDLMAERFPQLSFRVIARDNSTDECVEVLYDDGERVDECCAFDIAALFDEDDTPIPVIFRRDRMEA
jgi:hypothetical protein